MEGLPKELRLLFNGSKAEDVSCRSKAKTYRFDCGLYLKIGEKGELAKENEMASIFHALGLGPKVVAFHSAEKDYLVLEEAKGNDLTHHLDDPETVCRVLAKSLRLLHASSVEGVPSSDKFIQYGEAKGAKSLKMDTFIHGDACLPNVIIDGTDFQAFVDTGLAGIGDRHIDLYWALWSLEYNFKTDHYSGLFKDLYGRNEIDEEKLKIVRALESIS